MEETLKMWKAILMKDRHTLKHLSGADKASQERYAMKEQEIGLHCYQAEESLTNAELALLKKALRVCRNSAGVSINPISGPYRNNPIPSGPPAYLLRLRVQKARNDRLTL